MSPARGRLSSGKELDPGGARPRADEAFTNHSHGKRQDVSGVQMSKNEKRGKKKKKGESVGDFVFHLGRHMGLGGQLSI